MGNFSKMRVFILLSGGGERENEKKISKRTYLQNPSFTFFETIKIYQLWYSPLVSDVVNFFPISNHQLICAFRVQTAKCICWKISKKNYTFLKMRAFVGKAIMRFKRRDGARCGCAHKFLVYRGTYSKSIWKYANFFYRRIDVAFHLNADFWSQLFLLEIYS